MEAQKKRFELRDDKLRATYAHSFPVDLGLEPVPPPLELYHGTARELAQSILRSRLNPRDQRYVHLSASAEAEAVGRRRDPAPAIIVDTHAARQASIAFYLSSPLFLAETVPPRDGRRSITHSAVERELMSTEQTFRSEDNAPCLREDGSCQCIA
jgi:putative RNA 2'-phosphotransferase